MTNDDCRTRLRQRLIDDLYIDALLLADEARSYFDDTGCLERNRLPPLSRIGFSCESLKVTTRLLYSIAWLLTQRAMLTGGLRELDALDPSRRLGDAPISDMDIVASLPVKAQNLVQASKNLHRRVARLDAAWSQYKLVVSPARIMQDRLSMAF